MDDFALLGVVDESSSGEDELFESQVATAYSRHQQQLQRGRPASASRRPPSASARPASAAAPPPRPAATAPVRAPAPAAAMAAQDASMLVFGGALGEDESPRHHGQVQFGGGRPISAPLRRPEPAAAAAAATAPQQLHGGKPGKRRPSLGRRRRKNRPASAGPRPTRPASGARRARPRPRSAAPTQPERAQQRRARPASRRQRQHAELLREQTAARPQSAPVRRALDLLSARAAGTHVPTSSTEYLRQARLKKQAADRRFAQQLQSEQRDADAKVLGCVTEANEWLKDMGEKRTFRALQTTDTLRVQVLEPRQPVRTVSARMFLREHDKLRGAYLTWARAADAGAGGAGGGAGGAGGDENQDQAVAAAANAAGSAVDAARAARAGRKRQTRAEVQAEIRAVLRETVELTGTLTAQLQELRTRGWNRGV